MRNVQKGMRVISSYSSEPFTLTMYNHEFIHHLELWTDSVGEQCWPTKYLILRTDKRERQVCKSLQNP